MVRVRQAEDMEKPLDLLLSALNIFRIITKVQDFESWLKAYHNKEVNEELAEGYKFFILSNICVLIDAIEIDYSLNLTEDFIFFRGRFKGLNIEEIPNTSEKTIFIKNVWLRTKPLRKAKNWTEIRASLENLEILNTIFELLYKKCVPKLNIEKDWALNVITKFYTLTFLNDTSEGIPKGCISPSTVRVSKASEYLNRVFEGYKLTLQYLWFKLLPEKDFSKSCLKEMHKAGNWEALDEFFGKINEEIMKPLINTLGLNLVFEPLLVISKRFDKKTLKTLLSNNRLKEPEYFKKKNIEDIKRWLDYKLLWYNVEVLSSTGSIFSGVPAFVSSLKGLTEFNKKSKDRVYVKIFKHPLNTNEEYNYSYGILIPSFSSTGIADYSGWLIFFDCATDHSVFGDSMFELAKFYIDKFKESGKIEVEEIEIEREIFREYLKERSEASVFDKIIFSNGFEKRELDLSKIETEIDNLRGLLFELLVFKWLHEMGNYDELKHNYKANKKEKDIDILSKKGNKIYLFECKVTAHKDEDTKEQIRRKVDALRALGYEQIVPILVTYSPLEAMIKESFRKEGIEVQDNFRAKIESLVPEDKRRFVRSIFERDSQDKESGLIELNDE